MIKGLYTAGSGMQALERRLKIVSNNLANVNTTGYKKEQSVQESFSDKMIYLLQKNKQSQALGELGTGTRLSGTYTDFSQGKLVHTCNELDLAINGNGFFTVQTPEGNMYTRNGNFSLNQAGQLVTKEGYRVLGVNGPVQTVAGKKMYVDKTGQISFDNLSGDQLLIVDFPEKSQLEKVGDGLYRINNEQQLERADNYEIRQGYQENSNINIISEMVEMIETNRLYEANQKLITTADTTLDKAVNSIGRLS